jgi:hypothetical protein
MVGAAGTYAISNALETVVETLCQFPGLGWYLQTECLWFGHS